MVSLASEEPKFDLMSPQQFEQCDHWSSFPNTERFGTLYLGGGCKNLHQLQSGDQLKPYRNHLDLKRVNFGKNFMVLLLETGQVYGLGTNKSKHFVESSQARDFSHE
jgi:alpha-tubulin suppressor-like RCC1 family protein